MWASSCSSASRERAVIGLPHAAQSWPPRRSCRQDGQYMVGRPRKTGARAAPHHAVGRAGRAAYLIHHSGRMDASYPGKKATSRPHGRPNSNMEGVIGMTALQLPAFLHGPLTAIENAAKAEGRRCAKQYQVDGTFPPPMEMTTVAPNDLVFTHNVADIHDEHPAWRLYMASEVVMGLCDTTNDRHLGDVYEVALRQ